MSKLLKPAELAKALDIQCANISMAVKNGTLDWDVNNEKRIDIGSLKNQMWINKQKAKGKTFDINRIYESELSKAPVYREPKVVVIKETLEQQIKQEQTISQITPRVPQEQVEYQQPKGRKQKKYEHPYDDSEANDLSAEKIRLEVEKLRNSDRLEKLKIAKLEGELLPVGEVESIFIWANADMKKTFEQSAEGISNKWMKNLGGTHENFIQCKRDLMEAISHAGSMYKENLLNGLENAVALYSEVRGRGERK